MKKISKKQLALASLVDSPFILGDLIDKHYHNESLHERMDMSDVLDFRKSRTFFAFVLRDLLRSNMNLSVREQVLDKGKYYTNKHEPA